MRQRFVPPAAILLALMLGFDGTASAAHGATRGDFRPSGAAAIPPGALSFRVLGAPAGRLAAWFGRLGAKRSGPDATALARAAGWTTLGFPLDDSGRGVMIEIQGRTQLGPVEIVFEDGALQRVAHSATHTYGRGLYELADFGSERRVMLVRLAARARSSRAVVRVLLTREAPPAG